MKLWILRPIEDLHKTDNPWEPWYDKSFGFIVRAETEEKAREMANKSAGDENRHSTSSGKNPWIDSKYSTCEELLTDGDSEVLMKDFAAA